MENPSIINHVSIGVADFERAKAFYDPVLATIGAKRIVDIEHAVDYGKMFPEFWVHLPIDGNPATVGNGTHICFFTNSQEEVNAFYKAALDAGATPDGEPGPRPQYGEPYYGGFVRDLDGHKIEANFWDMSKM